MWRVLLAIPRVETTDLRNGCVTVTTEAKPVYGNRLIISSCYSLDALRLGKRFLARRKRIPPWKYKGGILAKILWLSLFGLSQITKLQYILSLPKTFRFLIYKAKIELLKHSSERKMPWPEQSAAFTGHSLCGACLLSRSHMNRM